MIARASFFARSFLLYAWRALDPLYYACTRLERVKLAPNDPACVTGQNIFRVRLLRYEGDDLVLSDGSFIRQGDLLLKLHLHNVRLLHNLIREPYELTRARRVFQAVQQSLPGIAAYVLHHKKSAQIRGVIGITQLNRGVRQLGFDVMPIESHWFRRFKRISLLPIYFLSTTSPLRSIAKFEPKMLLMSRATLLSRHKSNI